MNELDPDIKLLLTNLYDRAFVGDEPWSEQVLRIVNKYGLKEEIQAILWPKKKETKVLTDQPAFAGT